MLEAAGTSVVVVMVVISSATVIPLTVVPGNVTETVKVEIAVVAAIDPETVAGYRSVSCTTEKVVDGDIVTATFVVPGSVVVYVIVISLPSELAGIAAPTPVPVNWLGSGRVGVGVPAV